MRPNSVTGEPASPPHDTAPAPASAPAATAVHVTLQTGAGTVSATVVYSAAASGTPGTAPLAASAAIAGPLASAAILRLPSEILVHVGEHLLLHDLLALARTSRQIRSGLQPLTQAPMPWAIRREGYQLTWLLRMKEVGWIRHRLSQLPLPLQIQVLSAERGFDATVFQHLASLITSSTAAPPRTGDDGDALRALPGCRWLLERLPPDCRWPVLKSALISEEPWLQSAPLNALIALKPLLPARDRSEFFREIFSVEIYRHRRHADHVLRVLLRLCDECGLTYDGGRAASAALDPRMLRYVADNVGAFMIAARAVPNAADWTALFRRVAQALLAQGRPAIPALAALYRGWIPLDDPRGDGGDGLMDLVLHGLRGACLADRIRLLITISTSLDLTADDGVHASRMGRLQAELATVPAGIAPLLSAILLVKPQRQRLSPQHGGLLSTLQPGAFDDIAGQAPEVRALLYDAVLNRLNRGALDLPIADSTVRDLRDRMLKDILSLPSSPEFGRIRLLARFLETGTRADAMYDALRELANGLPEGDAMQLSAGVAHRIYQQAGGTRWPVGPSPRIYIDRRMAYQHWTDLFQRIDRLGRVDGALYPSMLLADFAAPVPFRQIAALCALLLDVAPRKFRSAEQAQIMLLNGNMVILSPPAQELLVEAVRDDVEAKRLTVSQAGGLLQQIVSGLTPASRYSASDDFLRTQLGMCMEPAASPLLRAIAAEFLRLDGSGSRSTP